MSKLSLVIIVLIGGILLLNMVKIFAKMITHFSLDQYWRFLRATYIDQENYHTVIGRLASKKLDFQSIGVNLKLTSKDIRATLWYANQANNQTANIYLSILKIPPWSSFLICYMTIQMSDKRGLVPPYYYHQRTTHIHRRRVSVHLHTSVTLLSLSAINSPILDRERGRQREIRLNWTGLDLRHKYQSVELNSAHSIEDRRPRRSAVRA